MNRTLVTTFAVAAVAVSGAAAQPARTAYEIDVSAAGTKSQGLRGILYDGQGRPIAEGPVAHTPIGSFRWLRCRMLWDSCGRWRDGLTPPRSSYPPENQSVQHYRISYEMRAGRTYWTGELPGLGTTAGPGRQVETPMGMFRWTSGQLGTAHWRGWVPQGWPDLPLVAPAGSARRR